MPHHTKARLKIYKERLLSSRFVKDVSMLCGGAVGAQAASFAFMPFLTRIYGPESFGTLTAYTTLIATLAPLATLGYANAILLPKHDEEANILAYLSGLISMVIAISALVGIAMFEESISIFLSFKNSSLLYLIPISLLLTGFFQVKSNKAIRLGLFKEKSRCYFESNLIANILKLFSGFIYPHGITLVTVYALTSGLNWLLLTLRLPSNKKVNIRTTFVASTAVKVALQFKDFPLYRMPQGILNAVSMGLPVLMLTSLFGAAAAGQYSLAALALGAPVMLLGESVGEVFARKINQAVNHGKSDIYHHLKKATLVLLAVGIIPFGIIIVYGPKVFVLFFGDEWARAGEYARWMGIWLLSMLINRPSISALPALNLQKLFLAYEIVITICRFSSMFLSFYFFKNDIFSIIIFSFTNLAGNLILIILTMKATIHRDRRNQKTIETESTTEVINNWSQ